MKNKAFRALRLLSLLLVLSLVAVDATAAPLPNGDSALLSGIVLQGGRQRTAPVRDGALSASEYEKMNVVSLDDGLSLTSFGGDYRQETATVSPYDLRAEEMVCLTYDDDYFYVGLSLWLSSAELLTPYCHPRFGNCYFVSFSIGASPDCDLYQKTAYLTNQYYFSAVDLRCLAMSGSRLRRASDGASQELFLLNDPSESAYVDENGVAWSSSCYRDDVAFSLVQEGSTSRITMEARVPRGDLLRTLSARAAATAEALLDGETEPYYVGLSTEISLSEQIMPVKGEGPLSLCLGIPVTDMCPLSGTGESWQGYLSRLEPSSATCTEILPSAVYLVGSPPEKSPNEDRLPSQDGSFDSLPSASVPSVTTRAPISSSATSLDDDFLSELPDPDAVLPESEEILYDETSTKEEKSGVENSYFGDVVIIVASVLLFLSVIAAAVLFRIREKKEEKTKKSLKKDK